jgi:hypothetical protein
VQPRTPGWRPCWPFCRQTPSSSVDAGGYADRDEITSGSTCIYGALRGSWRPPLRGAIICRRKGLAGLDAVTNSYVPRHIGVCARVHRARIGKAHSRRWLLGTFSSLLTVLETTPHDRRSLGVGAWGAQSGFAHWRSGVGAALRATPRTSAWPARTDTYYCLSGRIGRSLTALERSPRRRSHGRPRLGGGGGVPAARRGASQRAGLTPPSTANILSRQRKTPH